MSSDAHIAALVARVATLSPEERSETLCTLTPAMKRELEAHWRGWAHGGQTAPPGDWRVWLIRAGRGFGKTRAGSEWVHSWHGPIRRAGSRWSARAWTKCGA